MLLVRAFLLAVVVVTIAANPCVLDTSFGRVDLTKLALSSGAYKAENDDQTYTFNVNICGPVRNFRYANVCNGTINNAKGYMVSTAETQCYPMSDSTLNDTTLMLVSPTDPSQGVQLHYGTFTFDNYERDVYFTIVCDAEATTPSFKYDREDYVTGHSTYYFVMKSKHACFIDTPRPTPVPKLCTLQTSAGLIDLTKLSLRTGAYMANDSSNFYYAVNICDSVEDFKYRDICRSQFPHAKAYQIDFDETRCWPAADVDMKSILPLSLIDPSDPYSGVELHYNTFVFDNYLRDIYIKLVCDPKVKTPVFEFDIEDYTTGHSKYHFKMTTQHACPVRSGVLSLRV